LGIKNPLAAKALLDRLVCYSRSDHHSVTTDDNLALVNLTHTLDEHLVRLVSDWYARDQVGEHELPHACIATQKSKPFAIGAC
jgi:hypothetical protein